MTDWCSWWPDSLPIIGQWSWCCYEHDMHLISDWGLAQCVGSAAGTAVLLPITGGIMWLGVKLGGPFYRAWQRRQRTT